MSELGDELTNRCRRLLELREKRDEAKAAVEKAENEYREYEAELFEEFEESGIEGDVKVNLGGDFGTVRFGPRETIYARVLDKDAVIQYFQDHGIEEEFTDQKLAKARLNELARENIEQGKDLPPGIDVYPRQIISITRSK